MHSQQSAVCPAERHIKIKIFAISGNVATKISQNNIIRELPQPGEVRPINNNKGMRRERNLIISNKLAQSSWIEQNKFRKIPSLNTVIYWHRTSNNGGLIREVSICWEETRFNPHSLACCVLCRHSVSLCPRLRRSLVEQQKFPAAGRKQDSAHTHLLVASCVDTVSCSAVDLSGR